MTSACNRISGVREVCVVSVVDEAAGVPRRAPLQHPFRASC